MTCPSFLAHKSSSEPALLCPCAELRRARLQFKKGQLSAEEYEKVINDYMKYANDEQERMGLDVFVHGEPERTDMCAQPLPSCLHQPSRSSDPC